MLDLRFIGVDDLGAHLLLSDDEGVHFRVPLNESLRDAVRRDRPRQGRLPVKVGEGLRPKEVQAMIRAGLTAEEVAERAGWPVEKVHRYEGPILGEREYVAGLARQVRVRPRGATHGMAPTLDARVAERMRSREIEPGSASWDSFRAPSGRWTVIVVFTAGGRQRQAGWHFDQLARTVSATDDEARWLSDDEDEQTPGPIPAPHLQPPASPSQVYDVEAEGGVGAPEKRRRAEPVDLMAAMRERTSQRGRRRRSKAAEAPGLDRVPDEALPLKELAMSPAEAGDPPPAHERDTRLTDDDPETDESAPTARMIDEPLPLDEPEPEPAAPEPAAPEPAEVEPADVTTADPEQAVHDDGDSTPAEPEAPLAPVADPAALSEPHAQGADDDSEAALAVPSEQASTGPGEPEEAPAESELEPTAESTPPAEESAAADPVAEDAVVGAVDEHPVPKAPSRTASRKSGRPSVPSWDDIMFGRKSE